MTPLIDIRSLCAVAREPVLRSVSLEVDAGEVHGLVGESGAGKTSIARALLGILPAAIRITQGQMLFKGHDLLTMDRRSFRDLLGNEIALIPQDPLSALNPSRRIGDQLSDGLRLRRGLSAAQARRRAAAMLAETLVADPPAVMRRYPHELSGGMRQRVLIAQAFMLEPKLIVADEPTTALDVTVQKQILRLIRALQERHGTALIFITHDLGVVAQVSGTMSVLYGGKVVEQGATAEVLGRPRHAYTRALLAANPRYDRPSRSLKPVPAEVIAKLREEIGIDMSPQ